MEYVKFDASEKTYLKKNLLYGQMEMLSVAKRYESYKELRKRELGLKSMLKRAVAEMHEQLKILDSAMPRMRVHNTEEDKLKIVVGAKKRNDLESEIMEIKRQLERLK